MRVGSVEVSQTILYLLEISFQGTATIFPLRYTSCPIIVLNIVSYKEVLVGPNAFVELTHVGPLRFWYGDCIFIVSGCCDIGDGSGVIGDGIRGIGSDSNRGNVGDGDNGGGGSDGGSDRRATAMPARDVAAAAVRRKPDGSWQQFPVDPLVGAVMEHHCHCLTKTWLRKMQ